MAAGTHRWFLLTESGFAKEPSQRSPSYIWQYAKLLSFMARTGCRINEWHRPDERARRPHPEREPA